SRQIQQAVDSQSAQAAATGRPGCGNRALTTLQEHAQAFLPPRDEAAAYCCALVRWCRSSAESVNGNVMPGPALGVAHTRPQCAWMIERTMDSPLPMPSVLVV